MYPANEGKNQYLTSQHTVRRVRGLEFGVNVRANMRAKGRARSQGVGLHFLATNLDVRALTRLGLDMWLRLACSGCIDHCANKRDIPEYLQMPSTGLACSGCIDHCANKRDIPEYPQMPSTMSYIYT